MEKLINNPGLQHIAENIFLNLDDDEDIMNCQRINQSCQQILNNPTTFWVKKWIRRGLSKENQISWKKAIQMTRNNNTKYENNIVLYMKKVLKKNGASIDIPCFIDEDSMKRADQVTQSKGIDKAYEHIFGDFLFGKKDVIGCVQLLAPMVENPNHLSNWYWTPIHWAVEQRNIELIKALAPLIDNPNEPNSEKIDSDTPIATAIRRGDTEIVKILAPLSSNLNKPIRG